MIPVLPAEIVVNYVMVSDLCFQSNAEVIEVVMVDDTTFVNLAFPCFTIQET